MTAPHPLHLAQESVRRGQAAPIDYVRLTGPQRGFAGFPSRLALWRGANSIGKSHVLAWDIIHTTRGTHPYRSVNQRVSKVLVVGESWAQMDPLCEKLWEMLPKDEIDPRVRYEKGGGFQGFKNPRIPFVSGPGAGSVIILATYSQGTARIKGGQYHAAFLDEPPPEHIYGEVFPRLNKFNGTLRIGLTPTPDSPPLLYLKDLVDEGAVAEVPACSLTVDAVTPRGGLIEVPWMSADQIEAVIAGYLEVEREQRAHGAWTGTVKGAWLTGFTDDLVTDAIPTGELTLAIGIDHGTGAGRQRAMLVGVEDGPDPLLWILDEACSDGRTSPRDDAKDILAMISRWGLTIGDIQLWVGDRAHGGDRWSSGKENKLLIASIADLLDLSLNQLPPQLRRIPVPRKGRGSMTAGVRQLNGFMLTKRCRVARRCVQFAASAKAWKGNLADPHKDILDAGRYAMEKLVEFRAITPVESIRAPR